MLTVLLQTTGDRRMRRYNFARWPLALALLVAALSFLDCGAKQEKAQPALSEPRRNPLRGAGVNR